MPSAAQGGLGWRRSEGGRLWDASSCGVAQGGWEGDCVTTREGGREGGSERGRRESGDGDAASRGVAAAASTAPKEGP